MIDEYCGGMLAGPRVLRLSAGRRLRRHPARVHGDIPLDFDTLQPHGCFIGSAAVVILSDQDKARGAAVNLMKFFHDESCGKCTPCRVGTGKAVDADGRRKWNQPLLEELSQAMMDASICGLGQAAPNPALSVMKFFPARGVLMGRGSRKRQLAMMPIEFKLNGQTVLGRPDEPIITTAKKHGVDIPHLCHGGNQRSDGNCRACVVEIKGERVLAPSCCRYPSAGMEVTTDSPRALASQKMVLELLLSDMTEQSYTRENKLAGLGAASSAWASRGFSAESSPRRISRTPRSRSTSMPASSARAACAPAARCR